MVEVQATTVIQVPFYDVDAMQIVWHGHYVKYMERARCDILDLIDYNYEAMAESGFMWPVVDLRLKYIKPLKFGQVVVIKSQIEEVEYGLKVGFVFYDQKTGEKLTKAHTKQVAVDAKSGEMCLLSPPVLQHKLDAYQDTLT